MGNYFVVTIQQIAIMFAFIVVGWLLGYFKVLPHTTSGVLGKLLVWVFIPASIIKSFASNFTIANLSGNLQILLIGCIVSAVCFVIAQPLGKAFGKDDYEKKVYAYSFVIPNITYVGLPLVLAVFGEAAGCSMIVFSIPLMIIMYTWGMAVLTKQEKISLKSINNPVMYSLAIGIILGLLGINIPKIPAEILTSAGSCLAPSAMLLAGLVLSRSPLKKMFINPRAYLASVIRLVILPIIVALPMLLLNIDRQVTFICVLVVALPMGLNSIVFPEAYGQDASTGASTVIISHIMCVITVPLITALLLTI